MFRPWNLLPAEKRTLLFFLTVPFSGQEPWDHRGAGPKDAAMKFRQVLTGGNIREKRESGVP